MQHKKGDNMLRFLFALLLTASTAVASQPVFQMHSKKCVNGTCSMGQGTAEILRIIDGHVIWVTAGHCLGSSNKIEINGKRYESKIIARVKVDAIVPDQIIYLETVGKVDNPGEKVLQTWTPSVTRTPKVGDEVHLIGWPLGRYKRIQTVITSVTVDQFTTKDYLDVGASGGAVVYEDDRRLCGMILAYFHGTKEQICGRFDYASQYLRKKGDLYLVPSEEKAKKNEPPAATPPPVVAPPVATVPPVDIQSIIDKALEENRRDQAERDKRRESQAQRDRDTRVREQARREDAARKQAASHAAEIERLRSLLQDLADKPVTPPVVVPDPVVVPPIVEPQTASDGPLSRVPWGLLGTVAGLAGVAVPGGALGMFGFKMGMNFLSRRRRKKAARPPSFPTRDTTEAEQILELAANEVCPTHDAIYGVLFRDAVSTSPHKTGEELQQEVLTKFNKIAPISSPPPAQE